MGFGHFGRSLAGLLIGAEISVRAYDPVAEVPVEIRADGPSRLVSGADVVVIATPIDRMRDATRDLRSALTAEHLVIDVGSVKQGPTEVMASILGSDVPWAATHPLFGPTNIARGERDLRAVVCPNDMHPDAADRARSLYEQLGCRVIDQTAADHDQMMARTHALAFFIAKGLIDIGAGEDLSFSPPSFQALAKTIESVRGDASHLFLAIERGNPYASASRQNLLDALSRVHRRLEDPAVGPQDVIAPALAIPDMGAKAPELMETRDLIDAVDSEIIDLLVRRGHLASRAGDIKADRGRAIRDPDRERTLMEQRRTWARDHDLPEDEVADIFAAILYLSRQMQARRS